MKMEGYMDLVDVYQLLSVFHTDDGLIMARDLPSFSGPLTPYVPTSTAWA